MTEAGPRRHVTLKMPWGQYSKGHVFTDMPPNQAGVLIGRGIAEYSTADMQEAPNNRMIGGKRGKGGRVTK